MSAHLKGGRNGSLGPGGMSIRGNRAGERDARGAGDRDGEVRCRQPGEVTLGGPVNWRRATTDKGDRDENWEQYVSGFHFGLGVDGQ